MWAVRQDRRLKLVRVPARRRGSIMTKTIDRRGRLNRAIRSKLGHLAWLSVGLPMVCLMVPLAGFTLVQMVGVFGPSFIVSFLQIAKTCFKFPCPFEVKVSEEASSLVRDHVVAPVILLVLVGTATCVFGEGLDGLLGEQDSTLRGLVVVYPWFGLIRATLAVRLVKKSAEKAGAPVVNAADASTLAAATTPVPVAACGSEDHSDVTVMAERSRAGEEGADAAKRLLVKNAQKQRSLPTAVVIGTVSCVLIVRYLRRRT